MAAPVDKDLNETAAAASPYMVRDPEAFARNFGQAIEQGGRALAAYLKPRENGQPAEAIAEATSEVLKTLGKIGEYWTSDPARLMEAQSRLLDELFRDLAERHGAGVRERRHDGPARASAPTSASPIPTGAATRSSAR